jgi:hypothetical protein
LRIKSTIYDDKAPYNAGRTSGYTTLQSLVYFTRSDINRSILSDIIPNDPHPNPYAKVDDTHPPSGFEHHNVKPFIYDFAIDPESLLKKWGCQVYMPMNLETLYRVREYGPEDATSYDRIAVFGYPIYIRKAGRSKD